MKVSYIPQQLISVFSFNFYVSLYFIAEDVDFEYEYSDKERILRKLNKYKNEHDFSMFNISKKSVTDILMKNSDEVDKILKKQEQQRWIKIIRKKGMKREDLKDGRIYTKQDLWKQFIKNKYFDNNKVFQFTLAVLNEFDYSEFIKVPGSSTHHHNYEGGLKVHTESVVEYCLNIASKIPYINKSVLTSAAYLHDMGKMFDYKINEETKEIEITTECRLVYHICSVLPFIEKHSNLISKKDFLHIKHCILAHHGKHEWKSPVTPQTPEAYILHTADMLSSRLDDYKPNNNQEWQSHLRSFGGSVWNPNYEGKEHGC